MKKHLFALLAVATLISSCSIQTASSTNNSAINNSTNTSLNSVSSSTFSSSNINNSSSSSALSPTSSIVSSSSISTSSSITSTYLPIPEGYFSNRYYPEDSEMKVSEVTLIDAPDNYPKYEGFEVYVAGSLLDCYNVKVNRQHVFYPNNYDRANSAVGMIKLKGKTTVQIRCPFNIDSVSIKPLAREINPIIDSNYNVISFEVNSSGQYTVEINGTTEHVLHLFVSDNYYSIESYKTGSYIYFGPGVHNKYNSSYINSNNEIVLQSNQTLILDEGSVVQARIVSNNTTGIKVVGLGVIDGSTFDRNANENTRCIPFDFNYCQNFLLEGVSFLDPAGWCLNVYFCTNATIRDVKIITSRANGDGISLQSCQHIVVDRCFVRSFDDSIVIKNYPQWSNRNLEGTTDDILVQNCLIWTDLAQSLEIGYECVGEVMKNIRFKDITVLHNFHKPVLSIHNSNNANVTDVTYENITVDNPAMGQGDGYATIIEFNAKYSPTWSNVQKTTALGSVKTVKVKNMLVRGNNKNHTIRIEGSIDERPNYDSSIKHMVSGVTFTDVSFGGTKISSLYKIAKNGYTSSIYISQSESEVTGATLPTNLTIDELGMYGRNVNIVRK